MKTLHEVHARTILRVVVGSTVHGTNVDDGLEDRDEMAVYIEPVANIICDQRDEAEHFIYRTAEERAGKVGVRSVAGDLDLAAYSLRKWTRLALAGNPTIMLLLYSPLVVATSPAGERLRELAPAFASKQAAVKYIGYMNSQRDKLNGKRGGMRVTRQELIDRYGYDTKFAMQMLRLGYQGNEFLRTGRLRLPMHPAEAAYLRSVRMGAFSLDHVNEEVEVLSRGLMEATLTSTLPDYPDHVKVWNAIQQMYNDAWRGDDALARVKGAR